MNASTTRARTGRSGGDTRRDARSQARGRELYGAPVDGANALQIDYADPEIDYADPEIGYADSEIGYADPEALPRPAPRRRPRVTPATVAPPAPMALPRAPFLVVVVGLVIVGVLGVLVLNTRINENSFVLDGLRAQQSAMDQKEQQLSQDLEEAQSPGNLRAAAKRLGLVPAGTPAFITLPDGKIIGVPTPATATTANSAGSDR
jgi:hypothetical protein